jgi:hypothetical protein
VALVALRYRELHDEDWLRQRYELERRSTYTIAAELGCDDATVSRALRRFGIKGRLGRPAAVKPGEVYGLLTVIAELAERDRGGRVFLCSLRLRQHPRRAGRRAAGGKDALVRLSPPDPAARHPPRRALRPARRVARGAASGLQGRAGLRLCLRMRSGDDSAWLQPQARAYPLMRVSS